MGLSIEDKYDELRQLITMGKEKGYLLKGGNPTSCVPKRRS